MFPEVLDTNSKEFLINIGTGKDSTVKDYANFIINDPNAMAGLIGNH